MEQAPFEFLGNGTLHFSDDSKHITYSAIKDKQTLVIVDQATIPAADGTLQGTPIFSPDSKQVLFASRSGGKWRLVRIDVQTLARDEGLPYDAVLAPVFSPDGKRVAFRCADGDRLFPVVDGKPYPACEAIATIAFSPAGQHVAYMARVAGASRLFIDGSAVGEAYDQRLSSEKPMWDSEKSLHLIALRDGKILRVTATIP